MSDADATLIDAQDGSILESARPKRQKANKFEQFKQMRRSGAKNKYESESCNDVFELVSEEDYAKIVRDRQDDDWIVHDACSEYVDDGREIFDDDDEYDDRNKSRLKDRKKNTTADTVPDKKSIKNFCSKLIPKFDSKPSIDINDENVMNDLLSALHNDDNEPSLTATLPEFKPYGHQNYNSTPLIVHEDGNSKHSTSISANPFAIGQRIILKREASSPLKNNVSSPVKGSERKVLKSSNTPHKEDLFEEDIPNQTIDDIEMTTLYDIDDSKIDDQAEISENLKRAQNTTAFVVKDHSNKKIVEDMSSKEALRQKIALNGEDCSKVKLIVDKSALDNEQTFAARSTPDSAEMVLPLICNKDGQNVLRMYWLDAFEDIVKHPGIVFLFGKVEVPNNGIKSSKKLSSSFVSCCVQVKGLERVLYFVPKATDDPQSQFRSLYDEIRTILDDKRLKINNFRMRKVQRRYAFDVEDIAREESDYMEVRYDGTMPQIPLELVENGGVNYSHVFGRTTSALEVLMLEKKLKGPGWIEFIGAQESYPQLSWAKLEATVDARFLHYLDDFNECPPSVNLVSLALTSCVLPGEKQAQIISCAVAYYANYPLDRPPTMQPDGELIVSDYFSVVAKPSKNHAYPFDLIDAKEATEKKQRLNAITCNSERDLLNVLLSKVHRFDTDVIVAHELTTRVIELLLSRIAVLKIPQWSRLGRLKRVQIPSKPIMAFAGRLLCDVCISARELIRAPSFDLSTLVNQMLNSYRLDILPDQILASFRSGQGVMDLLRYTLKDSEYSLKLWVELNAMPLALNITKTVGGILSRTLAGGRAERNEYLLLHAFTDRSYICPDKHRGLLFHKNKPNEKRINIASESLVEPLEDEDAALAIHDSLATPDVTIGGSRRRKPAYAGGLVLEPKTGFYENFVLLLDFNSLYPSIIQEFNICFSTIDIRSAAISDGEVTPPSSLTPIGILPTEIGKLVDMRREVKRLMQKAQNAEQKQQYNTRQMALKLTANSMYGCLGFANSRFHAQPLAALITSKGREILQETKTLAEKFGLEVIYGDTDSIMINTSSADVEKVKDIGKRICREVNKLHEHLKIDIDGVYRPLLLLKKKKYAGMRIDLADMKYTQEVKGLDIIRRDWAGIAKQAGHQVLAFLLSGEQDSLDKVHQYLIELAEQIRDGKIRLEKFEVYKQLTKAPEDYSDAKGLPHVQVAKRLALKKGKAARAGDTIAYIVCDDGKISLPATQRAYNITEIKESPESLKVDVHYYLSQQIHPVVTRLCEPIEGTNAALIAECLGLDPSGYVKKTYDHSIVNAEEDSTLDSMLFGWHDCAPLELCCPYCSGSTIISFNDAKQTPNLLLLCEKCNNKPYKALKQLVNQLLVKIKALVKEYQLVRI